MSSAVAEPSQNVLIERPRSPAVRLVPSPAASDPRDALRTDLGQRFSVLVVDDHELVLCGLRLMLATQQWVERCLSARDLAAAVTLAERYQPRLALVDVRLGDEGGQAICDALRQAAPDIRIVLMTSAERLTRQTVSSMGAACFVSKSSSAKDIVRSVRMAGLGMSIARPAPTPALLSARQHEVLELLGSGGTNGEIAQRLFLSAHTVKQHTSAVYRKLKVRNRAEAIRRAQSLGLLM
jgi:two-component system response regulator DesR